MRPHKKPITAATEASKTRVLLRYVNLSARRWHVTQPYHGIVFETRLYETECVVAIACWCSII